MQERFTDRALNVLQLAHDEAARFNHEYVGTEHILLGVIKDGSGVAAHVLKALHIDMAHIRQEVENDIQSGPARDTMGTLPMTPRADRTIEWAIEESKGLRHNYVGTEHLLLGLVREHESLAGQILINCGVKLDAVRNQVCALIGS